MIITMNYLTELKLFYDWLESHKLTPEGISLWHALMQIANRSGWSENLRLPLSIIEIRARIPRAAIYRERQRLLDKFKPQPIKHKP